MELIITEISKYLITILLAVYTFMCFSYFSRTNEGSEDLIIRSQRLIIYLMHFVGLFVLYINQNDIAIIFFYIGQVIFITLMISMYKRLYPRLSQLVLNNMSILICIGFIILTRLEIARAIRQFIIIVFSFIVSLFVPVIIRKIKNLANFKYAYAILGIVMLGVVLVLGVTTQGARLNIGFAGFSIQPSELVKILFVFYVASSLYADDSFKNVIITSCIAAFQVIILVVSRDLGAAVILFVTYVIMLYVATRKIRYIGLGLVFGVFASILSFKLFDHVKTRVHAWQDPIATYNKGGYQLAQSLFAIGTGSWFGMGLTMGMPENIPVADEDFVFSAICEEMGIIFGICIIFVCVSCYIMFLNIAMQLTESFYKLVALGLGSCYIFQTFLNIGGVVKFIPSTGVTLPLISYGGSSILSTMIMFAIIQGLYVLRTDEEKETQGDDYE